MSVHLDFHTSGGRKWLVGDMVDKMNVLTEEWGVVVAYACTAVP